LIAERNSMANNTHSGQVYRPDIDGLRAVAVLGVIVFHAFPKTIPGGFVGVDVFFVISGFLITSIILREMREGSFSFLNFYARRIRRIFPALVVTFIITAVLGWFLLVADEYSALGSEMTYGAAFLANINYYMSTGYFDRGDDSKYLLHLWSLAVEEQYYLLWPLILYVLHRLKISISMSLIILCALSFGANLYATSKDMSLAFYMPFTRFWELMVGALLVNFRLPQQLLTVRHSKMVGTVISASGLVCILIAFFAFDRTSVFPGWRAAVPVVGAALVIASPESAVFNRILANRMMVALGLVSYPIYLLHWPLLTFAKTVAILKPGTSVRLTVLAASLFGAIAIYRFVELPLRQVKNLHRVALSSAVVLLAIGLSGLGILTTQGFPARWAATFGPDVAAYKLSQQQPGHGADSCGALPVFEHVECKSSAPLIATDVVMIGDSHAGALFPKLRDEMLRDGKQLAWLGGSACPFLLDIERDNKCGDDPQKIFDLLARQDRIETVILASRWPLYATNRGFGAAEENDKHFEVSAPSDLGLTDPETILVNALNQSISALEKSQKKVVLYLNVPELGIDPSRCVSRPLRTVPATCSVPRRAFLERTAAVRAIILKLQSAHPQLIVFDPSPVLCTDLTCDGRRDGVFLYSDDDHVSLFGSSLVAASFMTTLKKLWAH
jgi:peptidoglycan/LPS O-acetylase OafA/YrhL